MKSNDLSQRVLFVGGKGGVGKTTIASAMATGFASQKLRVLLLSTDPAHNLGDVWQQPIGDSPTTIAPGLDAIELDAHKEVHRYISQVQRSLRGMVRADLRQEVDRQLELAAQSPGAHEAALLDRLTKILQEQENLYDRIVIDTAPTGHTLHLLTLPESMTRVMESLLQQKRKKNDSLPFAFSQASQEQQVVGVIEERKDRFSSIRDLLLDHQRCAFLFVLTPEALPLEETRRALKLLKKYSIRVAGLVVNGILPETSSDPFLLKRRSLQDEYLKKIEKGFSRHSRYRIHMRPEDVRGQQKLLAIAQELFSQNNLR